jgi:FkbM family methyltransferase
MNQDIHEFDNGLRVYNSHLIESQQDRYADDNVHEAEEEEIFHQLLDRLSSGACYVNIGSAIGYYPILARKKRPDLEVHAYEPLAESRERIAENLSLNGLERSDIEIHDRAVSREVGWSRFINTGYGSRIIDREVSDIQSLLREAGSFLKTVLASMGVSSVGDVRFVRNITLDRIVADLGRKVDLVQLDVQGLELQVLKGGTQTLESGWVRNLLIGTHGPNLHRDCKQFLQALGYEIEFTNAAPKDQPDGILVARQ